MLPVISKTNEHVKEMFKLTKRLPARLLASAGAQHPDTLAQSAPAVLQRYSSASMEHYPNLPLDSYRDQSVFHRIDLETPGLQLISTDPYIFLAPNFLCKAECDRLIALHASSEARGPSATSRDQSHIRNSTTVVPEAADLAWLRERISKLANVDIAQLAPTKLTHYKQGEFFGKHVDTDNRAFGDAKRTRSQLLAGLGSHSEADLARLTDAFEQPTSVGRIPDRFCSVFVYLNNATHGGRTTFSCLNLPSTLDEITSTFDTVNLSPDAVGSPAWEAAMLRKVNAGSMDRSTKEKPASLSVVPTAGCAVIHFPTASPKYFCVPDERTRHESEPAISPKFVAQQFIWSSPIEEAKAAINAYVAALLSVAIAGEKERGAGGVVLLDSVMEARYLLPSDFLSMPRCTKRLVDQLEMLARRQHEKGRAVIFEIADEAFDIGTLWSVSRELDEDGWHAASPPERMPLAGMVRDAAASPSDSVSDSECIAM